MWSAYRIREFIALESRRRSSAFLSTRAFQRRSLPSKERISKATKQGSSRWKRRSLNRGYPFSSRQTTSPSRTAERRIVEPIVVARKANVLNSFPLRETRRHRPLSIIAKARKPSYLFSYRKSEWSNGRGPDFSGCGLNTVEGS